MAKETMNEGDNMESEAKPVESENGAEETLTPPQQTQSNTWKESSLQNVLVQYGMPDKNVKFTKPVKPAQHAQRSRKIKKKASTSLYDGGENDDDDDDRQMAKREHNLQVYHDIQVVRDCYYNMYMTKLRDKVETQREEIKRKSDALENRIKAKEEKDRRDSHKVKKRLEKHTLRHNEDFVNQVPKSDYYKILAVQNKLDNEGMLRTQEEKDEFWKDVRKPNMLNKYMRTYNPLPDDNSTKTPPYKVSPVHSSTRQNSVTQPRSRTSSYSSVTEKPVSEKPVPEYRPMTQIAETRETSRPATREAATESPTQKPREPSKKPDPHTIAKLAAAELDKKYPQMELPPMACFDMELGEETLDPDMVIQEMDSEHRRKERKLFVKRLRRMYHLSQSNRATAQRILTGHDITDKLNDLHNPAIGDIIAVDRLNQDIEDTLGYVRAPLRITEPARPWTKHLPSRPSAEPPEAKQPPSRKSSASSGKSKQSRASSATIVNEKPVVVPIPLSLESVVGEHSNVKESKCLSTMWSNYLHVGKSKFASIES